MNEQKFETLWITPKGIALLAAIDAGMLDETEEGWDDSKFEVFWADYSARIEKAAKAAKKANSLGQRLLRLLLTP